MDVDLDHYVVLGLPSGEEGAKLSQKDIKKAYQVKALELHPDKRPDDPNANDNFQKLKASYEFLKNEEERKKFDSKLRHEREKIQRRSFQDSKKRKMMSDLEERERSAFAVDPHRKSREEEEIARKLKDEVARIRAMFVRQKPSPSPMPPKENASRSSSKGNPDMMALDKEKMLKVSWGKVGGDYTAQRLREIFGEFGAVEDVVKKKRSALVVMASKDAAAIVAAMNGVLGDFTNPLVVSRVQPVQATKFPSFSGGEADEPERVSEFVGAGYQAFEDAVLAKMI